MNDLLRARLAAEAASVELSTAARNQEIRNALAAGMTVREIEAASGIPRSTVHRIGASKTLTEPEYLRLANAEVIARAEVAALESVAESINKTDVAE